MNNISFKSFIIKIYESLYPYLLNIKYPLHIMNSKKTIKYIKKHNCSIARFGDGELSMVLDESKYIYFQSSSSNLKEALTNVLNNNNNKLLICVPIFLKYKKNLTDESKSFWTEWNYINTHKIRTFILLTNLRGKFAKLGNTQVTRPYIDYKNKKYSKKVFISLKQLWKNRDLLIVEGSKSRLGIGNDLFNNAKSIKRIIAPAVNAFDKYSDILKTILNNYNGELVLIALGPTATVLASDLTNHNIQALDIGHLDIEYEWYKMKTEKKVPIKGKYTNEAQYFAQNEIFEDSKYNSQIIASIDIDNISN